MEAEGPAFAPDPAAGPSARRPYRTSLRREAQGSDLGSPAEGLRSATPPRCAWVVLVMLGEAYEPGALVVAHSLREVRTAHSLVCMVTSDVSAGARARLRGTSDVPLFDLVVEVPYLEHATRPFASGRQAELYNGWISRSFTKWNCLGLTQFDRVILADADLVFLTNCDELFELRPPAACFSNPWARPHRAGGLPNPYAGADGADPPHGAPVAREQIATALRRGSFVGWGALVLLAPAAAGGLEAFRAFLGACPVFGAEYRSVSGADEVAIAAFCAEEGWTHLHPRYLAIPWKADWVSSDIRAVHFHGRKPWDEAPDEWPDLEVWWRVAARLSARVPALRPALRPWEARGADPAGAADHARAALGLAQLRLTDDLRAVVARRAARGGRRQGAPDRALDAALEWRLVAALNAGPEAASVHRASAPEDAHNRALAAGLLAAGAAEGATGADEVVASVLALSARRLGRPPRSLGAAFAREGDSLVCGSHVRFPVTQRLARLIELGGAERAGLVALRYAALVGSTGASAQLAVPAAHAALLHREFGVRFEGFASPLDARLFGLEGAVYHSLFPDTDGAFGSAGSFFLASGDPAGRGGWLVHPPPLAEVAERAALQVARLLSESGPTTAFVLLPESAREACTLLRANPAFVSEEFSPGGGGGGGRAGRACLEDAAGARTPLPQPYVYLALSTVAAVAEEHSRLGVALRHLWAAPGEATLSRLRAPRRH